jgi:8-oxo-dGTP diphosphatase
VIRHFTASGIVISDDSGHVLLIEHRKLGCWLYPGGHINADEDPVQAVLREVCEETGITCQVIAEARFSHPATTVLAAPFTICVQDIPATPRPGRTSTSTWCTCCARSAGCPPPRPGK